jgi:hypothetical protein
LASSCAAAQVDDPPGMTPGPDPMPRGGVGNGGSLAGSGAGTPTGVAGTAPPAGSSGAGSVGSGAAAGQAASGGTSSAAGVNGTGGSSGSTASPVDTNLPFSEDFEDGQANGFLPWNKELTAGAWDVVPDAAGKVYQPHAPLSELEFAVGGSSQWTDVSFFVKVRLADEDSGANLLVRMKDPDTYLVVEMAVGKYKLRGRASGSTTDLVAPSPKPVILARTWYTVGVAIKGSAATLTLDQAVIGTATAQAAISSGGIAVGVSEGSASFDDIRVVAPP